MPTGNRLSRIVHKLDSLPAAARPFMITLIFGNTVKFVHTAGIRFLELTGERAVLVIPNRPKVRNHIGTVHASAMGLLAETATGAVLGMNVPDDRVPVLRGMRVNYLKRAKGALTAVATLDAEMLARVRNDEKGDLVVPVKVTDESGEVPLECEMLWAWRPKKKG
jgi:uncharacterized protein (TIGR00369 family)